jgi:hypothetical protein
MDGMTSGGPRKGAGRPPTKEGPKPHLTFRPTQEQLDELKAHAEQRQIDTAAMVRVAVAEWLELERLGWTEKVR